MKERRHPSEGINERGHHREGKEENSSRRKENRKSELN